MPDINEIFALLHEKCQEDSDLLHDVLVDYVNGLNDTELTTLEDFLVNNFGDN